MSRGPDQGGDRQRILVVCYANICRSPLAEALLKRALREAKLDRQYVVRSAGVRALPGAPAAPGTQDVARTRGLELGSHRSRRLTAEMARESEIRIALDEVVEEEIGIVAGPLAVELWPVDDPYGGSPADYERACAEIETHVRQFVADLRRRPTPR